MRILSAASLPLLLALFALAAPPLLAQSGGGSAQSTEAAAADTAASAEAQAAAETITFAPGLRIQGRYAHTEIDGNNDFYIARVRLKANGDVYGIATYYTEVKLDNVGRFGRTVNAQIENAWLNFPVSDALAFRLGLYDMVFSRNALTSDSKLLLMDRSLVKDALTVLGFADNTVGVLAHGRPWGGHFEYGVGVFDNLQFEETGTPTARSADGAMFTGRVVVHLLDPAPPGGYADYRGSYIGEGRRLSIGTSAGLLTKARTGDETTGEEYDIRAWGADVFFNYYAFTFEGEYDLFVEDQENANVDGDGWYVQAGYLVLPRVELAARYQELTNDDADGNFSNKFKWTSLGLNYYIRGHNLKVQADYTFRTEEVDPVDNNVFQVQLQMDF
jgi:hypothetical protein